MKKILLVEDDLEIVDALSFILGKNYIVETVSTKRDALEKINNHDLTILDITLPDGNSLEFYHLVKTPIIFLTASDDDETIEKCLSDNHEYISKPFKSKELLMRIEKLLKGLDTLKYKDLTINKNACKVYVLNKEVKLTALDYKILLLLLDNINTVVTKDRLIDLVFNNTSKYVEENTINVYLKRVRDKIDRDYIKTIKRVGYIIEKE